MSTPAEHVRLLSDLVTLPSVNPEHEAGRAGPYDGEQRVADYVESYFRPLGLRVERQTALPGRDNVIVHVPGADSAAPPILLEAHMDTIDVVGMQAPFDPRVEGGRLYGRGSCDTKGALAAMMLALREFVQEGARLPRGVCLAAAVDEEFGQKGVQRLVESGMRFAGAIVGEPTGLHVVAAHNGHIYFKIVTCGRGAHTSNPRNGQNAIYAMNDIISALRRGVDSVYPRRAHPLTGQPQLTVSIIHGGYSEHIVPDHCEVSIDVRVIPGESWESVRAEVHAWLADGLDAETLGRVEIQEPHHNAPPVGTPVKHPLVQNMLRAARGVLGTAEASGVPYNTDASFLFAAGVPCVVFGPGDIAQAHTTVEYVEVQQVTAAVQILKNFLQTGL